MGILTKTRKMISSILLISLFACQTLAIHVRSSNTSYYQNIDTNLNGTAFQAQLAQLISRHKSLSYKGVWSAFDFLDEDIDGCMAHQVRGIYSSKCWAESEQCGNYKRKAIVSTENMFGRNHGGEVSQKVVELKQIYFFYFRQM